MRLAFGRTGSIIAVLSVLAVSNLLSWPIAHSEPGNDAKSAVGDYGNLPLSFEVNEGQANSAVKFLSRGSRYTLFLTGTEAVLRVRNSSSESPKNPEERAGTEASKRLGSEVIRLKSIGANPHPKITGLDELPGKSNYFIGADPSKWRANISNYAKVKLEQVYPGIDLVYYGNRHQLEYDWIVGPGADPTKVRFAVEGKGTLELDSNGNLVLDKTGEMLLHKPVIYQNSEGGRTEVDGEYALIGNRQVEIRVKKYDTSRPLIIDPVLSCSRYLGGNGADSGNGIAVDSSGNSYITGVSNSSNFSAQNPLQPGYGGGEYDAFVSKLNAAGDALLYSTYLGGSGSDKGNAIAVDSFGNAYVTGTTTSSNFPLANQFQGVRGGLSDGFVAKLNAAGNSLVYSTYVGGSGNENGAGIAVDSSGNAYVTGQTDSVNFPTNAPFQASRGGEYDAFITKLSAAGNALLYSTYLGGTGSDYGLAIAVDSSGAAYVSGGTHSLDFPTFHPLQAGNGGIANAFVAKVNASGTALVYSTYLGGNNWDFSYCIAVDSSGNAYVGGTTASSNFPIVNPLQASNNGGIWDAFIAKLNPSGNALVYSTYLGGSDLDFGYGIAVDAGGNAYLTGTTSSANFPTVRALQANRAGSTDSFIAKLNASGGALLYSSYLGGNDGTEGHAIAVDVLGKVYVTGGTYSTNFPGVNAAQSSYGGNGDAFVAMIAQCTAGTRNLCICGDRFSVDVEWSTPDGSSGKGTAVSQTADSGYFWFFGPDNIELLVKILDGRSVNGHFWFFWGAMTDVQYTITIRDTETGAVKTVHGQQGKQESGNDINAF